MRDDRWKVRSDTGLARFLTPRRAWALGAVVAVVVVGAAILRFDPYGLCEGTDHRLQHLFWCELEIEAPFDQVVALCEEVGGPFVKKGRILDGRKWVLSADEEMMFPHRGGARECRNGEALLHMRVLEFNTQGQARQWIHEDITRFRRLSNSYASVYLIEALPEFVSLQNLPKDEVINYTFDDYQEARDDTGKPYTEEGVFFRMGRYGGKFYINRRKPPLNTRASPPHLGRDTYFLGKDYYEALYKAIDVTIPRIRLLPQEDVK